MDETEKKLRKIIAYKGMYGIEDDLTYAIGFVAGFDHASTTHILKDFDIWLLEKYFEVSSSQVWPKLIERLAERSAEEGEMNVDRFLSMLQTFLDERSGVSS